MRQGKAITLSAGQMEAIELGFWNGPVKAFKKAKAHDTAFVVDDLLSLKREALKWSYSLRDIVEHVTGIRFVRRPGEFGEEHQCRPILHETEAALDGLLFAINNIKAANRKNSATNVWLAMMLQRAYRSIDYIDRDILNIESMAEQGLLTINQGREPKDYIFDTDSTGTDMAA